MVLVQKVNDFGRRTTSTQFTLYYHPRLKCSLLRRVSCPLASPRIRNTSYDALIAERESTLSWRPCTFCKHCHGQISASHYTCGPCLSNESKISLVVSAPQWTWKAMKVDKLVLNLELPVIHSPFVHIQTSACQMF